MDGYTIDRTKQLFLNCSMNSESRNLLDISSFEFSSTDMSQEILRVNHSKSTQILELVRLLIKAKS